MYHMNTFICKEVVRSCVIFIVSSEDSQRTKIMNGHQLATYPWIMGELWSRVSHYFIVYVIHLPIFTLWFHWQAGRNLFKNDICWGFQQSLEIGTSISTRQKGKRRWRTWPGAEFILTAVLFLFAFICMFWSLLAFTYRTWLYPWTSPKAYFWMVVFLTYSQVSM